MIQERPNRERLIRDKTGSEGDCVYLPGRISKMHYRVIDACSVETYSHLLEHGWRRFGRAFFRPVCSACRECRSLRVDVESFRPNRSMRRTQRRNSDLRAVLRPASLTEEHLELYLRYHEDMSERRGWSEKTISPLDYYQTFVAGQESYGHELLLLHEQRLLAVALVDVLPRALSAVYCYYDPRERDRALGVFAVLQQIGIARARGLQHLYLGFWIADNVSMRYKAKYRPHELLQGRPELDDEASWEPPELS